MAHQDYGPMVVEGERENLSAAYNAANPSPHAQNPAHQGNSNYPATPVSPPISPPPQNVYGQHPQPYYPNDAMSPLPGQYPPQHNYPQPMGPPVNAYGSQGQYPEKGVASNVQPAMGNPMGQPPNPMQNAAPPPPVTSQRTICGMKKKVFWIVLILAILIVLGAGLGAGLGIALGKKKNNNNNNSSPNNSGSTPTPTGSGGNGNPTSSPAPTAGPGSLNQGVNTLVMSLSTTSGSLCTALNLHQTTTLRLDVSGSGPNSYTAEYYAAEFPSTQTFTADAPIKTNGADVWSFEKDISNSVNGCFYTGDFLVLMDDKGDAGFKVTFGIDNACTFGTTGGTYPKGASCEIIWLGNYS